MAKAEKNAQRILLAEEDVIIRFGIAEYLRDCGLTVLEAATSREAKAILQALSNINVLISDPSSQDPKAASRWRNGCGAIDPAWTSFLKRRLKENRGRLRTVLPT